jgi:hypothetical protein
MALPPLGMSAATALPRSSALPPPKPMTQSLPAAVADATACHTRAELQFTHTFTNCSARMHRHLHPQSSQHAYIAAHAGRRLAVHTKHVVGQPFGIQYIEQWLGARRVLPGDNLHTARRGMREATSRRTSRMAAPQRHQPAGVGSQAPQWRPP